jgi:Na+-transporting methylmalonyl-CoA/oxaloacetate decarboxylase gamma subunit
MEHLSPGQFGRNILVMAIGVIAAVLGLLIAAACIWIPRVVSRRNDPYNHADALAYEKETGRSVQEIEQGNAAVRARQSRSKQRTGTDA